MAMAHDPIAVRQLRWLGAETFIVLNQRKTGGGESVARHRFLTFSAIVCPPAALFWVTPAPDFASQASQAPRSRLTREQPCRAALTVNTHAAFSGPRRSC
jgi:hypothetical protein